MIQKEREDVRVHQGPSACFGEGDEERFDCSRDGHQPSRGNPLEGASEGVTERGEALLLLGSGGGRGGGGGGGKDDDVVFEESHHGSDELEAVVL